MGKRHVWMALAVVALCSMAAGCAVYGQQRYGFQEVGSVTNMEQCLRVAGGPDLIQKVGANTVCVYRGIEGFQVLGIYGEVTKKDRVFVFDEAGKMVSDNPVNKGKGMFILGAMSPIFEVE